MEGVINTLLKLEAVAATGFPVRIEPDILVPMNQKFVDVDCGGTAEAIKNRISEGLFNCLPIPTVHEVETDIFCGALNGAMVEQLRRGCTHSLIVSSGCAEYITPENMRLIFEAFTVKGARATGLAITELAESIMKGQLANTVAGYHIASALTCGGFDLAAANARVESKAQSYLRGYADGKDQFVAVQGVEEIRFLLRLVELYGECILPILPTSGRWEAADPTKDPVRYQRDLIKMLSKLPRKMALATSMGFDLSFLESGLIKN